MREALEALDTVVVIDVALTETGRLADYVLPGVVAVREVGGDVLHPRVPAQRLPPAPPAARPLPGHAGPSPRSTAGWSGPSGPWTPTPTPSTGSTRPPSGVDRRSSTPSSACWASGPTSTALVPVVLYETLGPTLATAGDGRASRGALAQTCALTYPESVRPAGLPTATPCSTRSSTARPAWRSPSTSPRRPGAGSTRPTEGQPRGARAARGAARPAPRRHRRRPRLPVRAGGRRAAVVDGQHDLPRPGVAEEGPVGALRMSPADADALGLADGARAG